MRMKKILSVIGASLLTITMIMCNPANIYANEGTHIIDPMGNEVRDGSTGEDECYYFVYVEDNIQYTTVQQRASVYPACTLEYGDKHLDESIWDVSDIRVTNADFPYTPFLEEEVATLTYGKVYMLGFRIIDGYYNMGRFLNNIDFEHCSEDYTIGQLVRIDGSVPLRVYEMLFSLGVLGDDRGSRLTYEDREMAAKEFDEWAKEWDKQYESYSAYTPIEEEATTVISVEEITTTANETTAIQEVNTENESTQMETTIPDDISNNNNNKETNPIIKVLISGIVIIGVGIIAFKATKK